MHRLGIALGFIAAFLVGVAATFWWFAPTHAAETTDVKWVLKTVGAIPKTWGDLVGVTMLNTQTILVFKDGNGSLRRVQWNANGSVNTLVHVIERQY